MSDASDVRPDETMEPTDDGPGSATSGTADSPSAASAPAADTSEAEIGSGADFRGFIVALGASAGGLDALDRFFETIQPVDDAAFVVIQHLAPEHKTMMDSLLARHTDMPVSVASDGAPLKGGHVYVIPPGTTMTVSKGHLRVVPRPTSGIMLPIDAFLQSLALENSRRSVGIVLSGTGSDGTRGSIALAQVGGWILAQDPDTARFDGMPQNAIATGVVDEVLSPEDLAHRVEVIISAHGQTPEREGMYAPLQDSISLDAVLRLLRSIIPVDFAQYKPATLLRRVERRMQMLGMATLVAYSDHVARHPEEVEKLRQDLLIPVTRFFRDRESFEALRQDALLPMIQERGHDLTQPFRVWGAGCATGQEAYSIAITLLELMEEHAPRMDMKIFATDVEASYVDQASAGRYRDSELQGVSEKTRERWFRRIDDDLWQVKSELRQSIVFSRHDLLMDAPFTHLDLVVCRNVLIYFQPAAQDRALRRLTYALKPGGVLFLGSSESPSGVSGHFEVLDARNKLYQLNRRPAILPPEDLVAGQSFSRFSRVRRGPAAAAKSNEPSPHTQAVQTLNRTYAPPSVLITAEREVLHVFGDVGQILAFREGDATLDVLELLPSALMPVVATLIHGVLRDQVPHRSREVEVPLSSDEDGTTDRVLNCHAHVMPVEQSGSRPDHLLIAFEAVQTAQVQASRQTMEEGDLAEMSASQVADLERELAMTQANLHDTIQELGTANEELQATNEELMASNEELQSTNEELQSVNEELHTVNAEYQSKITELFDANADLESLTRAPALPLVFMDSELRLARFTPEATRIFRFREADIGRPIQDIRHSLDYDVLYEDLSAALEEGIPRKIEATDLDGCPWLITLVPHAARPGGGSRVVMSAVDVSTVRDVDRVQNVLDAVPESMAVLDADGIITHVNASWRTFAAENGNPELFHSDLGTNYLEVCSVMEGADPDAGSAAVGIRAVLAGDREVFTLLYPCHGPDEERWLVMNAAPIVGGGAVVTHVNITPWIDPKLTETMSES